jgi:3-oxoacyl-[acyl-carrier protein] reductase
MDLHLKGKVAVVTGASKGIGAGIAKELAAEGALVVVNYATSKSGAAAVVAAIESAGGTAVALQGNVSIQADVIGLFQKTNELFGKVDILVNNAAVFTLEPVARITEGEFRREFDTNVLGMIFCIQESLKYFPQTGGHIVNITSVSSESPGANMCLYASTKGAVDSLTMALATELAGKKIRVNAVAPGSTETEGTHSLGVFGTPIEQAMIDKTPLGRFGQPKDIATVVAFLVSTAAGWVTGERIRAAGGSR